ncbi:MAG: hypothetical protein U5Q44_07255 [Dehalococcoidia bacterium]|nr:hypothetical protein [Dehalococcoidia bacterium]
MPTATPRTAPTTRVVLHLVAANDTGATCTLQGHPARSPSWWRHRRKWLPARSPASPRPAHCEAARGRDLDTPSRSLARRRLRVKAARSGAGANPGQALYRLLLRTLGGTANADAFESLAESLPLPGLLESAAGQQDRALALAATLRPHLGWLPLRRAGVRPAARPERRVDAAAALVAALWPEGAGGAWPAPFTAAPGARVLLRSLRVAGVGRSLAIELAVNAVIPAAVSSGAWTEDEALDLLLALPSPGTYGHLRRLEGWLAHGGERPFGSAGRLQAGLLLHGDYCSRGRCGRCPLSS